MAQLSHCQAQGCLEAPRDHQQGCSHPRRVERSRPRRRAERKQLHLRARAGRSHHLAGLGHALWQDVAQLLELVTDFQVHLLSWTSGSGQVLQTIFPTT